MTMSIVISELPNNIAKEFTVDEQGKGYVSRRGIARLSGVHESSIRKLLSLIEGAGQNVPKNLKPFAGQASDGELISPILVRSIIAYYYSVGKMTKEGCEFAGLPYIDKKPKNFNPEKQAQIKLSSKLNGQMEVSCKTGIIDILTDNEIIEVKNVKAWKNAIGQVLVYGLEFPNHNPRIHLFGKCSNEFKQMIIAYSAILGVAVSFD